MYYESRAKAEEEDLGNIVMLLEFNLPHYDGPAGLQYFEAHPFYAITQRIKAGFDALDDLETSPDFMEEGLWPFIRSLVLPMTDRIFYERNYDTLRRVTAGLRPFILAEIRKGMEDRTIKVQPSSLPFPLLGESGGKGGGFVPGAHHLRRRSPPSPSRRGRKPLATDSQSPKISLAEWEPTFSRTRRPSVRRVRRGRP